MPDELTHPNVVKSDSGLAPFGKGQEDKCYTSLDVKDWTKLGYAVPGNKHLNEDERTELAKTLRATYYW